MLTCDPISVVLVILLPIILLHLHGSNLEAPGFPFIYEITFQFVK